jgi:hypothetical protein
MMARVILTRLRNYCGDGVEYRIGMEYVDASPEVEIKIEMGRSGRGVAWWDLPLPPCPDCKGEIVWAEAGLVPGARECTGCGSRFSVGTLRYEDYAQAEQDGGECPDCGEDAVYRTCCRCKQGAWIIDCGHYDQPRPIAAHGSNDYCDDCWELQQEAWDAQREDAEDERSEWRKEQRS